MPEYTNIGTLTVPAGPNVAFTETPVSCNRGYVNHREGSGVFSLRGVTNQCRARYKISYGGNIAVATGGTAGPISVALAIEGEPLASATAIVTPAAVGEFFNVFVAVYVEVPCGCCVSVSVENTSTQAIDVANSNLIIERVA